MNATLSNGAYFLITKPTRITCNSATLIDHIITNDSVHKITPKIILNSLTDHYPIMCKIEKIDLIRNSDKLNTVSYYRDKKTFNSDMFCEDLDIKLFDLVNNQFPLNKLNFDYVFDQFVETIAKTIDLHAPLKRLTRKQQKVSKKPWITKGIFKSIKHKNSMFRTHFLNGTEIERYHYKTYLNKLTKIKSLSKKLYFQNEVRNSHKDPRKMWNTIRMTLPTKQKLQPPSSLKINESFTDNPKLIAKLFNNHFCTIGSKLAN